MSTYVIGDIHGNYDLLCRLLEKIRFSEGADKLWLVGDIVNRGSQSLAVCRFVRFLGKSVTLVLGNHDIHLMMVAEKRHHLHDWDTFSDVLKAPDCDEIIDWLRHRPLLHRQGNIAMMHAGVNPQWTLDQAEALSQEAEAAFQSVDYRHFLTNLYGNQPTKWKEELKGMERLRLIVNTLTRIRFCQPDGTLDFEIKGKPEQAKKGFLPWFDIKKRKTQENLLITGHWSAVGLRVTKNHICLDSGSCWGGALTAMRLEDRKIFQVVSHQ